MDSIKVWGNGVDCKEACFGLSVVFLLRPILEVLTALFTTREVLDIKVLLGVPNIVRHSYKRTPKGNLVACITSHTCGLQTLQNMNDARFQFCRIIETLGRDLTFKMLLVRNLSEVPQKDRHQTFGEFNASKGRPGGSCSTGIPRRFFFKV